MTGVETQNTPIALPTWHQVPSALAMSLAVATSGASSALMPPLAAHTVAPRFTSSQSNPSRRGILAGWSNDVLRNSYSEVSSAIEMMSKFIGSEGPYIKSEVSQESQDTLSLLYIFNVHPPKVASHDDESVAFSWSRGEISWYLAVSDGKASLIHSSPDATDILMTSELGTGSMIELLREVGEYVGDFDNSTSAS